MKVFGIFNLVAGLAIVLLFLTLTSMSAQGGEGGDQLVIFCFAIFAVGGLAVIDVIWLIALGCARIARAGNKLSVPQERMGRAEVTLVEYMKKARARGGVGGVADDEIERRLLRNGWSASEIRQAREILDA